MMRKPCRPGIRTRFQLEQRLIQQIGRGLQPVRPGVIRRTGGKDPFLEQQHLLGIGPRPDAEVNRGMATVRQQRVDYWDALAKA